MKRAKHSLSHYKLATFDMGTLVPVGLFEVLPGDTVQHATSALIRVSPLVAPVMHPVQVRIHHWYVPYRLLWDQFEAFITGGPDGTSTPAFPTVELNATNWDSRPLYDYFGVPRPDVGTSEVSVLPTRAYNMIWNEFYRDQDLQNERTLSDGTLARVAWEKDYFTSARPWPQKGPDVTIPLEGVLPVEPANPGAPSFRRSFHPSGATGPILTEDASTAPTLMWGGAESGNVNDAMRWADPALQVDLGQGVSATINEFRKAFAIQRYQEARARYGSRYTEYLRYLGVRSSDARLQRPEYLGGGKQTIAFSEVLQTGPDAEGAGVADLKGHGIAAMRSRRYRRFFEEHGVVISLASVRPRTMYESALHRMWLRRTKEDFWQKELEHIGMQEVYKSEVYGKQATDFGVFGYQDRYAEYRHMQSSVSGEFRSTLSHWHLARILANEPALNTDFVTCVPSNRIFASQNTHGLWSMFSHSIQARRMVSRSAAGRIY